MAKDYYAVLGVTRTASEKEIRQAFRRLARKYHPDVNRDDPATEERFKEVNEAYQVLSDVDTRNKYNKYGENWKHADSMGHGSRSSGYRGPFTWAYQNNERAPQDLFDIADVGLGDIFGDFIGRRSRSTLRRREPLEHPIEVTLEEAYQGTNRILSLSSAHGPKRRVEVKIPPGVDTASRIRISLDNHRESDIYLIFTVQPHLIFKRKGNDLYSEVSVPLYDALLGNEIQIATIKGLVALTIPAETPNGKVFRLVGQGMPVLDRPNMKGDLLATARVVLPKGLTEEELELVRRLKSLAS